MNTTRLPAGLPSAGLVEKHELATKKDATMTKEQTSKYHQQCNCGNLNGFTSALISEVLADADSEKLVPMLTRLAFDAAGTNGLYYPEGYDGPCSRPNPPKYCWYVHASDQLWVRDLMLEGLAHRGLGLQELGIRDPGEASISDLATDVFRAAAHSNNAAKVTAEKALDVLSIVNGPDISCIYPPSGCDWLCQLCKLKPWMPICWLTNGPVRVPVVKDLLTINFAYELGLLDGRYTVATLHGMFDAFDRGNDRDLSLDSAKAVVRAVAKDERVASHIIHGVVGGLSGLVTPESDLCTRENWEPWCLVAATRPRLSRLVNMLVTTNTVTPPQLQAALRAVGVVVVAS